jgi:hypothetical protein
VAGGPSLAYQKNAQSKPGGPTTDSLCKDRQTAGQLTFDTELIGITSTEEKPLDDFKWTDGFNGFKLAGVLGTGGILISPVTDLEVDPASGSGGIVITQIGGQPASPVPEPSTMALLLVVVIPLVYCRIRHGKNMHI